MCVPIRARVRGVWKFIFKFSCRFVKFSCEFAWNPALMRDFPASMGPSAWKFHFSRVPPTPCKFYFRNFKILFLNFSEFYRENEWTARKTVYPPLAFFRIFAPISHSFGLKFRPKFAFFEIFEIFLHWFGPIFPLIWLEIRPYFDFSSHFEPARIVSTIRL